MAAPATAEAINFYPAEEDELVKRRAANQYKGHVVLERAQAELDATTQLAEMVDGSMRTTFELEFNGKDDLIGPDGRGLNEVSLKAVEDAEVKARQNPNLAFEVPRRRLEREEILLAIEMAKGNGPNTMMIESDYPFALAGATEDIGGYNSRRQQAMFRGLMRRPNGNLRLVSQSLDGSNRQGLNAIQRKFGQELEPGEALGQRIHVDLTPEEQDAVMDEATDTYDDEMSAQFGGEWHAGRRPADYRNTYDFVCQQRDLIDVWLDAWQEGALTEDLKYKVAATMQARFEKNQREHGMSAPAVYKPSANVVDFGQARGMSMNDSLWRELENQGRMARAQGKSFSGCGDTLSAGTSTSAEGTMGAAGYGESGDSKSWHGGKVHKNAKCVSCEKVKPEVGACHICKDCVDHPKKTR
jgi:hypothetical protein